MTQESRLAFQAKRNANIIKSMCELFGLSLKEAADIYYMSQTSALIEEGVSDLHCRSPKYLATLVWEEYKGTEPKNNRPFAFRG